MARFAVAHFDNNALLDLVNPNSGYQATAIVFIAAAAATVVHLVGGCGS
jgi:hypothetical protein